MRYILFILSLLFTLASPLAAAQEETLTLTLGNETLTLEIARTPAKQEKGLMGKESLPDNSGMLFLFNPPQSVAFWMKNTPLDLDIAFINEKGVVFHTDSMAANTEDIHYSYGLTRAAIELKKGSLKRLNIGVGTQIPELQKMGRSLK